MNQEEKHEIKVHVDKEKEDVEELREVLKAVGDFLHDLVPMVKELIETFTSGLRGDVLGEEVAKFYKSLIEAGIREEVATKYTEEFLTKKMEILNVVTKIVSEMKQAVPQKKEVEVIEKKEKQE
ncbi:MAG: hypothetical protein NZ954_04190 [Thermofilaceae archaeon]|nr:hypothetical protein [Thermofilaceae archaeon]MCX8180059.1 hypothetical protein [Thermofilaceae archaeon]MDW8003199.1 hypothetical protein [Thermofilaceae archaeon]